MGIKQAWRALFSGAPTVFDESPAAKFSAPTFPVDQLLLHLERRRSVIDRESALTVPAVLRGRNVICSISTLPLQAVSQNNQVLDNPLLRQIDPNVPNVVTLAQTVEDLLFEGVAWWRVTSYHSDGYPYSAVRYDPNTVSISPPKDYNQAYLPSGIATEPGTDLAGRPGKYIWMNGEAVEWRDVIRFDSPNPPLLTAGARAIGRALALDEAADLYATQQRMRGYFTPSEGVDPASDEAIEEMLDDWAENRAKRLDGYVPAALKYNPVQDPTPAELQLIAQQQRNDLALANALGLDPEDLGISTTSRTYQNATDRRKDRINDVLSPYMLAITGRLSMPDVTNRNTTVRFWLDDYMKADPRTRAEVQQAYKNMGVIDAQDIQRAEGLVPKYIDMGAPEQPQRVESTVGEPVQEIEAANNPTATFSATGAATFEWEADATFSVDTERRTITGLAVPWGKAGRSKGRRYRFNRDSLVWSSISRVKLLRDHLATSALGKAVKLEVTDDGLVATLSVSPGRAGDEALALAADGVLDGLSIGVDFRAEDTKEGPDGIWDVMKAALREISLTAIPAFDDSRLTSVKASRDGNGDGMKCTKCNLVHADGVTECTTPEVKPGQSVTFTAEQFAQFMAQFGGNTDQPEGEPTNTPETRPVVDPTHSTTTAQTEVTEPSPYRFTRDAAGYTFSSETKYDFSTDIISMIKASQRGESAREAQKRVDGFIKASFADVEVADLPGNLVSRRRPDMWVPQRDYATPLWDLTGRGATPAGEAKFDIPKFTSSSGLVSVATEKTEPAGGSFVTEMQTITPGQLWGRAEITRQAWRQGGNPAFSGILWEQMLREFYEDREAAIATFLATLTAATDIALTATDASPSNDEYQATMESFEQAYADLQFARGGNRFTAFAVHQALYRVASRVKDDQGRPLYPMINPMNANGTTGRRYSTIDVAGVTWVPAYALGTPASASTNSWLFDPAVVMAWADAPERLFWDFGATVQTANIPQLSFVTVGIYANYAVANTDITGVRQVTFDPNSEA